MLDLEKIDVELGSPDENTRWQAAIALAEQGHCEYAPDLIWPLVVKWGSSEDEDVRAAISTCVLEHILECHFEEYFGKSKEIIEAGNILFLDTFSTCSKFGQTKLPENAARFDKLRGRIPMI